jgi:hypothetical protein
MRRPVNTPYTITTGFGVPDSYALFGRHSGVDYAVPSGRQVLAPVSGTLTNVVSRTGGNMVVIRDAQGFTHRLMHNSSFSRNNGAVSEGQEVAKSGTTGLSTGPHVHWDINKEGTYPTTFNSFISPVDWLAGKFNSTPTTGGNNVFQTDQEIIEAYLMLRGVKPSASEIASWRGRPKQQFFQVGKAEADSVRKQLADVKKALANEQAKPPKEIVKEVTKIVEKPVEIIKEVPVQADEKTVVEGWFKKLWERLFK